MERIFAYIARSHRDSYIAAGWSVTPMMLPHGFFSCIAEWVGDGEPVFPQLEPRP